MKLQGSRPCQAVRFTVDSAGPQPHQRCYCSVCRQAGGAGLVNRMAERINQLPADRVKQKLAVMAAEV